MNSIFISGNVVKDASLKEFSEDNAVVNFSVAVYDSKGTIYVPVEYWCKPDTNIAPYIKKGLKVSVCGKVKRREDQKLGVTAYEVVFMRGKTNDDA